jgi:hypothetical protein
MTARGWLGFLRSSQVRISIVLPRAKQGRSEAKKKQICVESDANSADRVVNAEALQSLARPEEGAWLSNSNTRSCSRTRTGLTD